ncbi:DUF4407 domain-containing protein [Mycobacterium sp. 050134]|uniref:DUF4407 domain-containing protein n=1 Tax=Mycobacterium sp. 050134 TaxID=3096111 RepID=UPI002ED777F8
MGAHENTEPGPAAPRALSGAGALLTWLGGGHRRELGEDHERSAHAVAGAIVLVGAAIAWAVAGLALGESTGWPAPAVLAPALAFGVLVGAITRATAGGPGRGRGALVGRAAVAALVGVVVGELAALAVFSGAIDHRLDEAALRAAESAPAVAQASAALQQARDARGALDRAVDDAREHEDRALVVARCEYHPTPACPQTQITGVPGSGPETRTANDLLAGAQRQLSDAVAARDRQSPELDARLSNAQRAVDDARRAQVAGAGRGLGARWVAMNRLTAADAGALSLRLATDAACALLYLLPLILGLWRGQTTYDRRARARAERERAELEADTAIAVKRAEVRREAEILWAEHQLTQARLAVEAQIEIDRERQRRRVQEALERPAPAPSVLGVGPAAEDIYLPIAAEAEAAASRAVAALPAGEGNQVRTPEDLPAPLESAADIERHEDRAAPLIPSLPDATRAAARWVRPLVPPLVARVIDNTTAPLRTARQVFEEVEEITFAFRRTRKVTVDSDSAEAPPPQESRATEPAESAPPAGRVASSRVRETDYAALAGTPAEGAGGRTLGSAEREPRVELVEREGPRRLGAPEGPRQLPPAE